ncbi:MAG: hypothetical protein ABIF77_07665 [bacterium]
MQRSLPSLRTFVIKVLGLVMVLSGLLAGNGVAVAQPAENLLALAVIDSMPLPEGVTRGLAWLNTERIVVLTEMPDSLSASGRREVTLTYQDRLGNVTRAEDFTGTLSRGLTYDGKYLWSCGDDRDGQSLIYKIEGDTCFVAEVYSTPGHLPCGTAWDGDSVWAADRDSGRLDRFDVDDGSVTRSVLTPGFSPYGVAHDGQYTWVSDSGTGRLYRLRGAYCHWNATVEVTTFCYPGRDVVLGCDGTFLWYVVAGERQAYQVRFP